MDHLFYQFLQSPVGGIRVEAVDDGVCAVTFVDSFDRDSPNEHTASAIGQLNEYFTGLRKDFDLPLQPQGTDFQMKVWQELMEIPYGTTWSYLDLAIQLGDPNLSRAVGTANGQNPISIIVPCHRVIGKNGDLTGYAGGIGTKHWLLSHEGALRQKALF